MSGEGPIFSGGLKCHPNSCMLCSSLAGDRVDNDFGFILPEIQLLLVEFQVFIIGLFDLLQSTDLAEKRIS